MNTQILAIKEVVTDPEHKVIQTAYTLEGNTKYLDIPFEQLTSFAEQNQKPAGYDDNMPVTELDVLFWSDSTIQHTTTEFIKKFERVDLIIENRKLRDRVVKLDKAMNTVNVFHKFMEAQQIRIERRLANMGFFARFSRLSGELEAVKTAKEMFNNVLETGGRK